MENLNKLVFVHYNMRLRNRGLQRQEKEGRQINLDDIFHEADPLVEWSTERDDGVLDGEDNDWLDKELAADATRSGSNDDGSDEGSSGGGDVVGNDHWSDGGNDGGGYIVGSGHDGASGSGAGGAGGSGYTQVYRRNSRGNRSGETNRSGPYSRNVGHHDINEPFEDAGYTSSYSSHDVPYYHPESVQQEEQSPFDNMMTSFFGGTNIQHYYPQQGVQFQSAEDHEDVQNYPHVPPQNYCYPYAGFQYRRNADHDDEDNYQEPHRSSFWV